MLVFLDTWLTIENKEFLLESGTSAAFAELVTAILRDGTIDRLRQNGTIRLVMLANTVKEYLSEEVWRDYQPVLDGLAPSNEEYLIITQAANHKSQV